MQVKTFFRRELQKFSFGVVGAKEFGRLIDDFQTTIDFLNDFLGIDSDRLHRFLTDTVLCFVVSDALQGYLLGGKTPNEKQADLLLGLIVLFDKLRDPLVKGKIVQFVFSRRIGVAHADLFLNNFETLAPVADKCFVDGMPALKNGALVAQLIAVYEKHMNAKFEGVSNASFSEASRLSVSEPFAKGGLTPEKKFHCAYTQRTGMISHLPWQGELLAYCLSDAVGLLESPESAIDNQIRVLLLSQLTVSSQESRPKTTYSTFDFDTTDVSSVSERVPVGLQLLRQ